MFKDGRVAGVAVPKLPSEDEAKFEAWFDDDRTGSPMWNDPITSNVPMDADWSQLTRPQQNWLRSHYPALEEGDDPPYPLGGPLALHQLAKKAYLSFGQPEGMLTLYVLVGADGVAKSVTTIGSPHPELTRYVGTAVMLQRYKPAICHGQPCEMAYVYAYKFITR